MDFVLFVIATVTAAISQINLPTSRWLIIRQKPKILLAINCIVAMLFVSFATGVYYTNPFDNKLYNFALILIVLSLIYTIRNYAQLGIVKREEVYLKDQS